MTISEPMTLSPTTCSARWPSCAAVFLLKQNMSLRQQSIRWWALALFASAMASYVGGTYHGFQHAHGSAGRGGTVEGDDDQHGGRELSSADRGVHAAFTGQDRRWLIAGAALKLAIYVAWMLGHDEFRFVIYDYGSTLAILLLLVVAERTRGVSRPPRVHRVGHPGVDCRRCGAAERRSASSAFQSQRSDARRPDGRRVAAL